MNVSKAKENILKRLRNALSQPVQLPFPKAEGHQPVFEDTNPDLEIAFAEAFTALKGRFVFCSNHEELAQNIAALATNKQWKNCYCRELSLLHQLEAFNLPFLNKDTEIAHADAGLTTCEALVARTGSVALSTGQPSGREVSIFPPVHLIVGYVNQLVYDINDAFKLIQNKYGGALPSLISFHSGPSRTSDIEKTSVIGVHGPGEVYVFLVDEEASRQLGNFSPSFSFLYLCNRQDLDYKNIKYTYFEHTQPIIRYWRWKLGYSVGKSIF